MKFKQELLPPVSVKLIQTDTARYYETPEGNFRSVTAVLETTLGTKELDEWKERVGHETAAQISRSASSRGTAVHNIFEAYLRGEPIKAMPVNKAMFFKIKPWIDEQLTKIFGIEHKLYSKQLQTAGTVDLIAEFSGKYRAVADYKTSKRQLVPHSKILHKYFLQATAYAIMVEELYMIKVPYIVIFILVDGDDPQIQIRANKQFREEVIRLFAKENNSA